MCIPGPTNDPERYTCARKRKMQRFSSTSAAPRESVSCPTRRIPQQSKRMKTPFARYQMTCNLSCGRQSPLKTHTALLLYGEDSSRSYTPRPALEPMLRNRLCSPLQNPCTPHSPCRGLPRFSCLPVALACEACALMSDILVFCR